MRAGALTATLLAASMPSAVHAQGAPIQVPALDQATAAATASSVGAGNRVAAGASASATAGSSSGQSGAAPAPPVMPPPVQTMSPSAPLDAKERQAVLLAHRWAARSELPQTGEDGVVRFLYGATLPSVVCAPLQVCDLALQPGEIVNNVNVGDKVRWNIAPALSGSPDGQITHLIIKPADAGLLSSMTIETNRRTYAVKLVSTQTRWMPLIAFTYPDDAQSQWRAYQQTAAMAAPTGTASPAGAGMANLDFGFRLSGDRPAWRPLRVYTDGAKTYIQFPKAMAFGTAPALVGLDSDAGWFSGPSQQMVTYRTTGDRYVVDRVLDRAELVAGVGSSQTRVVITREGAP